MLKESWRFFPYPSFKPNQEQLLSVVYKTINSRSHAIIDGASGLGKTVGSLAGALQATKEHGLSILYAARTYKELDRVVEELEAINRKEQVSGLSIRGRSEMCVNEAVLRFSNDPRTVMELCSDLTKSGKCEYSENMEDVGMVRGLMDDLLRTPTSASTLISESKRLKICPYEMAKLLLPHVDVIALNYAYLFSSNIRENFIKKLGRPLSEHVLILDEAHNLPEIASEFESDHLSISTINASIEESEKYGKPTVKRFSDSILEILIGMGEGEHILDFKSIVKDTLRLAHIDEDPHYFLEDIHAFGESIKMLQLSKGKVPRSYIHRLAEFFLRGVETSGRSDFVHILTKGEDIQLRLDIIALDPRTSTSEVLNSVAATISMSGTLEDMESYRAVMGLPENTIKTTLPSPFTEEQVLVLSCKGVSTLYEKRSLDIYKKMVSKISEVVRSTPGNTGIFCSSYEVMDGLLSAGLQTSITKPLFVEKQRARSLEQDRLLEEFKQMYKYGGAVLLGVMGGRFSEGEDYPGDEMNSVIIVGVPYPKPSAKVSAQINYYESLFPSKGMEYGYIIPAMRRASQAAGRPFRNLDDRGVVVFLDYRFSTRYLKKFLPCWISSRLKTVEDCDGVLEEVIQKFYSKYSNDRRY
ncbi:MAG: ATP-dependent DNA helicase [Candidatus Methanomethyliaceae archaeon]|nr:ATP-dependent DNA helicase [Candidatus Methanomethyliaceae archaeon]